MKKSLTKPFIIILVALVLFGCYFVFKPFLIEIFIAAVLASIFYTPYLKLKNYLKGRKNLAALLMCIFLVLLIIIPVVRIITYAGQQSVVAYTQTVNFFNKHSVDGVVQPSILRILPEKIFGNIDISSIYYSESFKNLVLDVVKKSSNWLLSGATMIVKGTTGFVISLFVIIITMFFFFVDGRKMLERLMRLSPLPDIYDKQIFEKFRTISYTTMLSTFVTAGAQGVVGAIGFAIIGFPAFLAGIIVGLLFLLPYLGSMIFYVPVGIYYIIIGKLGAGLFILIWGAVVIGNIDNVIRAYMIKDKAQINPIFVVFSILGGIVLFGFWGVVLGPLIISLAVTILHIYELEFCNTLDEAAKFKKEDTDCPELGEIETLASAKKDSELKDKIKLSLKKAKFRKKEERD